MYVVNFVYLGFFMIIKNKLLFAEVKSMADFNKDEAYKALEIATENTENRGMRVRVSKIEDAIAEIEASYSKDLVFDLGARARVAKDFLGYREALAHAAAECDALARSLDGIIHSSELQADLQNKKAVFQNKKAAFEALLGRDILVDHEAPAQAVAEIKAAWEAVVCIYAAPEYTAPATFDGMISSLNTVSS